MSLSKNHLSLVLTIICAYFSMGFLHPDEQYYAIDFAAFKVGILEGINSWEYDTQLRPWSLPFIFMPFLKLFKLLGMDPFEMSFGLRLISGLFSFAALQVFIKEMRKHLSSVGGDALFYALHFGFIFKLMMVRTNSENYATGLFLIAFAFALKKDVLKASIFSGLSFLIRHQLGFMVLPLGLYFLLVERVKFSKWLIQFCLPIFIVVAIGFGIDSLGYGELSFSPWNYIYQNIILDKVSTFGEHPFYYYLYKGLMKTMPWFILMVAGFIYYALQKRKDLLFWSVTLFILIHHLIAHKELRFLYPVAPLLLTMGVKWMDDKKLFELKAVKIFWIANLIVLPFVILKPAYTPLKFYKDLYERDIKEVQVVADANGRYPSLEMKFYKKEDLILKPVGSLEEVTGVAFTTKYQQLKTLQKRGCQLIYSSYPQWLFKFNYFNWLKRSNVWALTRC
ncbi:MAG: hypothetical protein ACO2ZP_03400 [Bacteriovoracaceae bacterium]